VQVWFGSHSIDINFVGSTNFKKFYFYLSHSHAEDFQCFVPPSVSRADEIHSFIALVQPVCRVRF
jgi:hypothetical protein